MPGGGISPEGDRWIACLPRFFLPVQVLSRLFRRLFLEMLEQAYRAGKLEFFSDLQPLQDAAAFARYLDAVRQTEWVVYAKPPFGGPERVLDYLGRYTHRIAISNQRLVSMDDDEVTFLWKDYRNEHSHATAGPGVHPALFDACGPARFPAHPVLRIAGQCESEDGIAAVPETVGAPGLGSTAPARSGLQGLV